MLTDLVTFSLLILIAGQWGVKNVIFHISSISTLILQIQQKLDQNPQQKDPRQTKIAPALTIPELVASR